jgi:hypothetical protein
MNLGKSLIQNMKYIIILSLFLICNLSCTKSDTDKKCYECEVWPFPPGTPTYKTDVCSDDIGQWQAGLKDQNGNNLQSVCTER